MNITVPYHFFNKFVGTNVIYNAMHYKVWLTKNKDLCDEQKLVLTLFIMYFCKLVKKL